MAFRMHHSSNLVLVFLPCFFQIVVDIKASRPQNVFGVIKGAFVARIF